MTRRKKQQQQIQTNPLENINEILSNIKNNKYTNKKKEPKGDQKEIIITIYIDV